MRQADAIPGMGGFACAGSWLIFIGGVRVDVEDIKSIMVRCVNKNRRPEILFFMIGLAAFLLSTSFEVRLIGAVAALFFAARTCDKRKSYLVEICTSAENHVVLESLHRKIAVGWANSIRMQMALHRQSIAVGGMTSRDTSSEIVAAPKSRDESLLGLCNHTEEHALKSSK